MVVLVNLAFDLVIAHDLPMVARLTPAASTSAAGYARPTPLSVIAWSRVISLTQVAFHHRMVTGLKVADTSDITIP